MAKNTQARNLGVGMGLEGEGEGLGKACASRSDSHSQNEMTLFLRDGGPRDTQIWFGRESAAALPLEA